MTDIDGKDDHLVVLPPKNLVNLTHIIYALHAICVLTAIMGAATIVLSFLAGIPSILALILNYIKKNEVKGTWLETHFNWQIRTFWFALLWALVLNFLTLLITATIIFLVFAPFFWMGAFAVLGIWITYRVIRGWWALLEGKPMPK